MVDPLLMGQGAPAGSLSGVRVSVNVLLRLRTTFSSKLLALYAAAIANLFLAIALISSSGVRPTN